MTRDEILALEPGQQLDALVAEHVYGWAPDRVVAVGPDLSCSTDIGSAWRVVEKLSDRYHWRLSTPFEVGLPHWAGLTPLGESGWNGRPDISVSSRTMPHAICLAALVAVAS